ncbi:MAG TPA: DUF5668 domain-containing protein [Candidatus Limnocylindrales bacterium]|nr:DUF5668 domain-containing protein [Candidatus Limnocylindrales bacterium]
MNQYFLIRRLRGPAILLLLGVLALLHTSGLIHGFWHLFWPLLLILIGVLMLAERAALAAEGGDPLWPFSGPAAGTGMGITPPPEQEPTTTQTAPDDFGKGPEGGQS